MRLTVETITSYVRFIRVLLLDSLWRNKRLSAAILITGFLGVMFQVTVFGLIVYYANHFSSGEVINVAGYTADARSSVRLLGTGSLLVVVLLLLSAWCIYFSRRTIVRLGREYEEFCSKRIFHRLGSSTGCGLGAAVEARSEGYLFQLARTDSRFAGRVLRMVLSLFVPGMTLMVASVVLVYLEPLLTFVIAGLSCVFTYYQSEVSRGAAGHSMRFEELASVTGREYKGMIQHLKQQADHVGSRRLVERMFSSGPVKRQQDAYEGRLRAVENSRLISGLFVAVIVGVILFVMGAGIIREGVGWGRLLIYIVALRVAMAGVETIFSMITAINQFYPQVKRYLSFVESSEQHEDDRYPVRQEYELEVRPVDTGGLNESSERMVATSGSCFSLVTPLELNRYTLASVSRVLFGGDRPKFRSALRSMRFATLQQTCPGVSLRESLRLSPDMGQADLEPWFPDTTVWELASRQLPKDLDEEIGPRLWNGIDARVRFIVSMMSVQRSDCVFVLVDARGLDALGPAAAGFYLNLLQDRIAVVVFNAVLSRVGCFGEHFVAVGDEERLVGLGSPTWFASVQADVQDMLDRRSTHSRAVDTLDEGDMDDF